MLAHVCAKKKAVLGTFEQLGILPRCDPTIGTTPNPKIGQGCIGLGMRGTGYQKPRGGYLEAVMGLEALHGVRGTAYSTRM